MTGNNKNSKSETIEIRMCEDKHRIQSLSDDKTIKHAKMCHFSLCTITTLQTIYKQVNFVLKYNNNPMAEGKV